MLETGRQWLGWIALRDGALDDAARVLSGVRRFRLEPVGAGPPQFRGGLATRDAVTSYTRAIEMWGSASGRSPPSPRTRSASQHAGRRSPISAAPNCWPATCAAAIRTLDIVHQGRPSHAHAHSSCGRAPSELSRPERRGACRLQPRQPDRLRRRAGSGQRRGPSLPRHPALSPEGFRARRGRILQRAEFRESRRRCRQDAAAWRHLSAVAGGSCASAREFLEGSLARVSPFFPKTGGAFPGRRLRHNGPVRAPKLAALCAAVCVKVQDKMASKSVNKVILLGHLGKDAETKFTPSGISVSKFYPGHQPLATKTSSPANGKTSPTGTISSYGEPNTSPISCSRVSRSTWKAVSKPAVTRTRKGRRSTSPKWSAMRRDLVLLGGGSGGGGASGAGGEYSQQPVSMPRSAQRQQPPAAPARQNDDFNQGITDDDVPF